MSEKRLRILQNQAADSRSLSAGGERVPSAEGDEGHEHYRPAPPASQGSDSEPLGDVFGDEHEVQSGFAGSTLPPPYSQI